jgi:hypothetical protein
VLFRNVVKRAYWTVDETGHEYEISRGGKDRQQGTK